MDPIDIYRLMCFKFGFRHKGWEAGFIKAERSEETASELKQKADEKRERKMKKRLETQKARKNNVL